MLLHMSVSGAVLILLIVMLRSLAMNHLPKKVFVLLWDIALLRLLIPWNLPISHGISTPVARIVDNEIRNLTFASPGAAAEVILSSDNVLGTAESILPQGNVPVTATLPRIPWLAVIWLTVAAALLLVFAALYIREAQKLRTSLPLPAETEEKLRALADVPPRIRLRSSDQISTPLTFGILSPQMILPKVFRPQTDAEWSYVLMHEKVHILRMDNLSKVIMLIAVCVHWFNPLVWVMYVLFNRDMELSCDEKVIACFGEQAKKDYAMALVSLAEKQHHWSLFSNGFGKSAIQERIVAIMKYKKITLAGVLCAVVLLGGALTVFAKTEAYSLKKSETLESASEDENSDGSNPMLAIVNSEYFPEYEKCGISYDTEKQLVLFNGQRVGYFKDETAENVYTRIVDPDGTIGVIITRDSDNEITAITATDVPIIWDGDDIIIEDTVLGYEVPVADGAGTASSAENDVSVTEGTGTASSTENDVTVTEDSDTAAAVENGTAFADNSGNADMEATTVESAGDDSLTLKAYESLGFTYEDNAWKYKGKTVSGLITDQGEIYLNENGSPETVYIQIEGSDVEEVSEKEFSERMEDTQEVSKIVSVPKFQDTPGR